MFGDGGDEVFRPVTRVGRDDESRVRLTAAEVSGSAGPLTVVRLLRTVLLFLAVFDGRDDLGMYDVTFAEGIGSGVKSMLRTKGLTQHSTCASGQRVARVLTNRLVNVRRSRVLPPRERTAVLQLLQDHCHWDVEITFARGRCTSTTPRRARWVSSSTACLRFNARKMDRPRQPDRDLSGWRPHQFRRAGAGESRPRHPLDIQTIRHIGHRFDPTGRSSLRTCELILVDLFFRDRIRRLLPRDLAADGSRNC